MGNDLLTTREAAELLGVGTTSVKRWADAGILECVRTPGRHRRFRRLDVEQMLENGAAANGQDTQPNGGWVDLLIRGTKPVDVARALQAERDARGAWWRVAEAIEPVLVEIGDRWRAGELTILQEHLASERLSRGLSRCCEAIEVPDDAPACLLVTARNETHTLGLALFELCVREAGWRTLWSGQNTPTESVREFLDMRHGRMVAVSASSALSDPQALEDEARTLGSICQQKGGHLLLGGNGPWPETPTFGYRIRTFERLAEVLRALSS